MKSNEGVLLFAVKQQTKGTQEENALGCKER